MELIEVNQARCTQCGICTYVCRQGFGRWGKVMCLWDWIFYWAGLSEMRVFRGSGRLGKENL